MIVSLKAAFERLNPFIGEWFETAKEANEKHQGPKTETVEVCHVCRQPVGRDGACYTEWCAQRSNPTTRFVEKDDAPN